MMRQKFLLLACVAFALRPHHALAGQFYRTLGAGATSCAQFLARVNEANFGDSAIAKDLAQDNEQFYLSWVEGFLTGSNEYDGYSVDADNDALIAWLRNYCATHPLEKLSGAVNSLRDELKTQQKG